MNLRYIRLGCAILVALIKSSDGRRYLYSEDVLLPQLAECFNQLDPVRQASVFPLTFLAESPPVQRQTFPRASVFREESGGHPRVGLF